MSRRAWSENLNFDDHVYQPNFIIRIGAGEPRLSRKSVLYKAFQPMCRVAKLAGVFSTSTVGSWKFNNEQDIAVHRCSANLLFSVLVTFFLMVDICTGFKDASLADYISLDGAANILFESFTRLCGFLVEIYMITTPKIMVSYLYHWKSINFNLYPYERQLRKEGLYALILTITLTTCCLVLSAWYMIGRFLPFNVFNGVLFTMKLIGYTLSLFNCLFVSFSSILFVRALIYSYRSLKHNVSHLLKDKPKDLATQLENVRQRYEAVYDVTNLTSIVYSPMLAIIVVGFSVSLCVLFFLLGLEASKRENPATIVRLIGSITYRIIPVILICVVGQQVTNEYFYALKYIYSADLNDLPADSKFQIRLLESKLLHRPAKISASNIVYIDYRLLGQIAGIIVTYSLVIIEFRKTY